jgi:hypothetical protein
MLANKKQVSTLHGVESPIPSPEIMREMAMGSAEDRATLAQIWDNLTDAQQQTLKQKIVEAMPDARNPRGVDSQGNQVFSSDAQKIMDAVEGREPSAAQLDAVAGVQNGRVPKKTESGPTQWTEEDGTSGSYVVDPSDRGTTPTQTGAMLKEAPGEQPKVPTLGRTKAIEGLDPKAAGLHDPGPGQSDVRDRQNFRVDYRFTQDENGNIVREADDHQLARADNAAWGMGEHYEKSMAQREQLFGQLLTAQTGSQQAAIELMQRFQDGDEAAAAILNQVRAAVDASVPSPQKPFPIKDGLADAGESTPAAQFDRTGRNLIEGSLSSNIYTPKRGSRDTAMDAWQLLQTKMGKNALIPNQVFASPRQMAEQYVRNMKPEWFDVTPITPNQRADAADTLRKFEPQNPKDAGVYLDTFNSDLPGTADKEVFRTQAIDQMEKVFAERFGSQWGEGAQTGTPVDPASMSPAPVSSEPAVPSGTSMDPNTVPKEGFRDWRGLGRGIPNTAGTHTRKSFEEMLAESMEQSDRLLERTRDSQFDNYLKSDEYVQTPSKPTRPPAQEPRNSPSATATRSFDPAEHGDDSAQALARWKADAEANGFTVEAREGGTYVANRKQVEGEEPEMFKTFGGGQSTYKDLSGPDQHKQAYRNFTDGEYKPGAGSSYEDWMYDHNRRNPMFEGGELDTRARMADEMSDRLPGLKGGGELRTSEILKQIDELSGKVDNYSPEIVKLQEELQAEGLTPARAKEIREQLKPMYAEHEASIAGHEAEIERLQGLLRKSTDTDKMTGILSAKKPKKGPPLAGKIKEKAAKPAADNPADTTPAPKPETEVATESDASVIEGRPETAPAPDATADQMAAFGKELQAASDDDLSDLIADPSFSSLPQVAQEAARAEHQRRLKTEGELLDKMRDSTNPESPDYIPPVNGVGVVDGSMEDVLAPDPVKPAPEADAPIDPLDSASSADIVDDGPNPLDADTGAVPGEMSPETDAAAKADEAEAPRDVEADRPAAEAETIPPGTGSEATPKDTKADATVKPVKDAKPAPTWGTRVKQAGKVGVGGAAVLGVLGGITSLGNRVNQANATGGTGGGGGMPGAGGLGMDGEGGLGMEAPPSDPFAVPRSLDSAARIRLMQSMQQNNSRIPTGIPQTAQQWR